MTNLKPCPFCGGTPMLGHTEPIASKTILNSYIICNSCGAKTSTFSISVEYSSDERAAEAWNRRTNNDSD